MTSDSTPVNGDSSMLDINDSAEPDTTPQETPSSEVLPDARDEDSRPTPEPGKPRQDVKYKGTGFAWSWLGWLIIVIAILPVIVQNTQIVQVRYLIWDIRVPLAAAFLAVAVIAEVATEIIGWAWRARRRRELAMKAELKELKRQTAQHA